MGFFTFEDIYGEAIGDALSKYKEHGIWLSQQPTGAYGLLETEKFLTMWKCMFK